MKLPGITMKKSWVIVALLAAMIFGMAAPAVHAVTSAPAASGATTTAPAAAPAAQGTAAAAPAAGSAEAAQKAGKGFMDKTADILSASVLNGISLILDVAMNLVGEVIIFMFDFIVLLAQYNNFTNAEIVRIGWPVLRDLVNLFFVIALLVISFATVLRIESYSYQKLLPRLVIVALLVNFSKLITGLVIDFSQVIMITFVNSFKEIAGAAFYDAFRLEKVVQSNALLLKEDPTYGEVTQNLVGKLFGFIFTLILLPVLLLFTVTLAYRIVALWMLVILSPLAFFSAIFSSGGKGGGGGHH